MATSASASSSHHPHPDVNPHIHCPRPVKYCSVAKLDVSAKKHQVEARGCPQAEVAESESQPGSPTPRPPLRSLESHAHKQPVNPTPFVSPLPDELLAFPRNTPRKAPTRPKPPVKPGSYMSPLPDELLGFPRNTPRKGSTRDWIPPTPLHRPSHPFEVNIKSHETVQDTIQQPASAELTASSAASAQEPPCPGSKLENKALALWLRDPQFRHRIIGDFCCPKCQTIIPSPRTDRFDVKPRMGTLLHLRCTGCPAVYCRGCHKPITCERDCNVQEHCALLRCCANVRGVAIFEYLSAFDRFYLFTSSMYWGIKGNAIVKQPQRRAFLDLILYFADQCDTHRDAQQVLLVLELTARRIRFWILLDEDTGNEVERHVGAMLTVSFLSEVLYEFISQVYARRKIRPPELETGLRRIRKFLNTLATRQDKRLSRVIHSPFSIIKESRGLEAWLRDDDDTCVWSAFDIKITRRTYSLAECVDFLNTIP
ncbi:hypothetical protein H2248_001645 [Termitomyces sp. 'cryptogamus']|nr:hypothetical protein H2248_001645 [Termitomyces sp. 'cryptogamus']